MLGKRVAAICLAGMAFFGGACGSDGEGTTTPDGEVGREDPTLEDGADTEDGNSTESNQSTDNGSGTGSGRAEP